MLRFHSVPASLHLSGLLASATAFQELAGSVRRLPRIPQVMRAALAAESVSWCVRRTHADGAVEVLVHSTNDAAGTRGGEGPVTADASAGARQSFISRPLNSSYRMDLLICRGVADSQPDPSAEDVLNILVDQLARSMQALLGGLAFPPQLAAPFALLTEREWAVLCGLNSDDGEKQLATRMNLSSHTLHSHIKSLYRKIGVRGRLALLQCFRRAWQEYRLQILMEPLEKGAAAPLFGRQITVVEQSAPLGYPPAASRLAPSAAVPPVRPGAHAQERKGAAGA